MLEGEEQVNSGEQLEASPEPQSEPDKAPEPAQQAQESEPKTKDTSEENIPFHKHPRWIERDNELKTEREARRQLEAQYQQMQHQLQQLNQPKTPDKRAAMIERLKGVDPEFAEFVSQLAPAKELEELRTWKQQYDQQQARQQVHGEIERLHQQHKVDDALKARYNLALEAEIRANPNARLQDLPAIYKKVHDDYASWIDSIRRAERESYVKAKSKDAAIPASSPKGSTPNPSGKQKSQEWDSDPEKARKQLIDRVLKRSQADNDLG